MADKILGESRDFSSENLLAIFIKACENGKPYDETTRCNEGTPEQLSARACAEIIYVDSDPRNCFRDCKIEGFYR